MHYAPPPLIGQPIMAFHSAERHHTEIARPTAQVCADLERRIVASRVPELPEALVEALVRTVRVLRGLELRKSPSVAETIDWGRTLLALGLDTLDDEAVAATLGVVLKHQSDVTKAAAELRLN